MKVILMGAPGSGKGTQGPYLQERYELCHLATGDMLREAVANKSPFGVRAKDAMDKGELVTDEIVFGVLGEAMRRPECSKGYVIDGVPRTIEQAERLEAMGENVDKVVWMEVPDSVLIERTSGRWIHRSSGRTYHEKFNPPKIARKDDVTGEDLMQRRDDQRDVVVNRLKVFHDQTEPLRNFYQKKGLLADIDGNRPMSSVRASLQSCLDPIYAASKPWWRFW